MPSAVCLVEQYYLIDRIEIIHLVRTQNFLKNLYFLFYDTNMYVYQELKNVSTSHLNIFISNLV